MATTCCRCGATSEGTAGEATPGEEPAGERVPLGWSTSTTPGGIEPLCVQCTRDHVRDIEAKLDDAWWS